MSRKHRRLARTNVAQAQTSDKDKRLASRDVSASKKLQEIQRELKDFKGFRGI